MKINNKVTMYNDFTTTNSELNEASMNGMLSVIDEHNTDPYQETEFLANTEQDATLNYLISCAFGVIKMKAVDDSQIYFGINKDCKIQVFCSNKMGTLIQIQSINLPSELNSIKDYKTLESYLTHASLKVDYFADEYATLYIQKKAYGNTLTKEEIDELLEKAKIKINLTDNDIINLTQTLDNNDSSTSCFEVLSLAAQNGQQFSEVTISKLTELALNKDNDIDNASRLHVFVSLASLIKTGHIVNLEKITAIGDKLSLSEFSEFYLFWLLLKFENIDISKNILDNMAKMLFLHLKPVEKLNYIVNNNNIAHMLYLKKTYHFKDEIISFEVNKENRNEIIAENCKAYNSYKLKSLLNIFDFVDNIELKNVEHINLLQISKANDVKIMLASPDGNLTPALVKLPFINAKNMDIQGNGNVQFDAGANIDLLRFKDAINVSFGFANQSKLDSSLKYKIDHLQCNNLVNITISAPAYFNIIETLVLPSDLLETSLGLLKNQSADFIVTLQRSGSLVIQNFNMLLNKIDIQMGYVEIDNANLDFFKVASNTHNAFIQSDDSLLKTGQMAVRGFLAQLKLQDITVKDGLSITSLSDLDVESYIHGTNASIKLDVSGLLGMQRSIIHANLFLVNTVNFDLNSTLQHSGVFKNNNINVYIITANFTNLNLDNNKVYAKMLGFTITEGGSLKGDIFTRKSVNNVASNNLSDQMSLQVLNNTIDISQRNFDSIFFIKAKFLDFTGFNAKDFSCVLIEGDNGINLKPLISMAHAPMLCAINASNIIMLSNGQIDLNTPKLKAEVLLELSGSRIINNNADCTSAKILVAEDFLNFQALVNYYYKSESLHLRQTSASEINFNYNITIPQKELFIEAKNAYFNQSFPASIKANDLILQGLNYCNRGLNIQTNGELKILMSQNILFDIASVNTRVNQTITTQSLSLGAGYNITINCGHFSTSDDNILMQANGAIKVEPSIVSTDYTLKPCFYSNKEIMVASAYRIDINASDMVAKSDIKMKAKDAISFGTKSYQKTQSWRQSEDRYGRDTWTTNVITNVNAVNLFSYTKGEYTFKGAQFNLSGSHIYDTNNMRLLPAINSLESYLYHKTYSGFLGWFHDVTSRTDRSETLVRSTIKSNEQNGIIRGNLELVASDINVLTKSLLEIHGPVQLSCAYENNYSAIKQENDGLFSSSQTKSINASKKAVQASITTGGNNIISSLGTISATGSSVAAGGLLLIKSAQDIILMSGQDEEISRTVTRSRGFDLAFINSASENTFNCGFYNKKSEVVTKNIIQHQTTFTGKNVAIETGGALRGNLQLEAEDELVIKAKELALQDVFNIKENNASNTEFTFGLKVGVHHDKIATSINAVQALANKQGDHAIDKIDTALKLQKATSSIVNVASAAAVIAKGPINQDTLRSNDLLEASAMLVANETIASDQSIQKQSVGSNIKASTIKIEVENDISIVGAVAGKIVDITARSLELKAGVDSYAQNAASITSGEQFGIKLDRTLKGGMSLAASENSASNLQFTASVISGSEALRIDAEAHIELAGSVACGGEVSIKSKSLSVETLKSQANSSAQTNQFTYGVSKSGLTIGGGFTNDLQQASNVTSTAAITGSEYVKINVQNELKLTGAIIANVNESGADGRNLAIKAGSIKHQDVICDKTGSNFGLSLNTSVASDTASKTAPTSLIQIKQVGLESIDVTLSSNDASQTHKATIGQGKINVGGIAPCGINRDITSTLAQSEQDGWHISATIDKTLINTISSGVRAVNDVANNISAANNKATQLEEFLAKDSDDASDNSAEEALLEEAFEASMRDYEASRLKKAKFALEKLKEHEAKEAAKKQLSEQEDQIYGGTSLAYHEQLDVAEECFSQTDEMGQHRRIEYVTSQDLHAIVAEISATNPEAANLLRGLDLNRITREITEEFLHELPKGESEPIPITIGGIFTSIFGIHSAYAGGSLIQGLNAAAKIPYGKKIIEKLLQHAGSALKSEAVKYVVDSFYSGVDDIADYFNKPFEKAKASDANKNKAESKNLPTSSMGSGQLPEDPDEKRKSKEKFSECEKAESAVWKKLQNHRIEKGKQVKTNGLPGKEREYYQWDNQHKEIEVLDHREQPKRVISPMTGRDKGKDVSNHFSLRR